MPNDKLKNQLHLHFIVFIWGFTAILGALISIEAVPLVWYRVLIASAALFVVLKIRRVKFNENLADLIKLAVGGLIVGLHWVTFFHAIKISTVSTTLVTLSSSAFFVVLIKPFFEKKRFQWYELFLALVAIVGFVIIFKSETLYADGILMALASAFLVALFAVMNSVFIRKYSGSKIAFYELFFAMIFFEYFFFWDRGPSHQIFLTYPEWIGSIYWCWD